MGMVSSPSLYQLLLHQCQSQTLHPVCNCWWAAIRAPCLSSLPFHFSTHLLGCNFYLQPCLMCCSISTAGNSAEGGGRVSLMGTIIARAGWFIMLLKGCSIITFLLVREIQEGWISTQCPPEVKTLKNTLIVPWNTNERPQSWFSAIKPPSVIFCAFFAQELNTLEQLKRKSN